MIACEMALIRNPHLLRHPSQPILKIEPHHFPPLQEPISA